ncbi:MAG: hypothetical protein HY323_18200 [Betaproteobacteria bacterium]|nr:hypothetical protein [Betaproteobacteria bacterium]MBI3938908.1 hypothetical protein [Betaproteobacteria bacterium]
MASSNTHTGHASNASLRERRSLRCGRSAFVLVWLALWLGGIGFAYFAMPPAQAGSGGNVAQSGASDHGTVPHHYPSAFDNPDCRESRDAGTASQQAVPLRLSGDESANLALLPAMQRGVVRADDQHPGYHSYPRPPSRALYLRILRLLI